MAYLPLVFFQAFTAVRCFEMMLGSCTSNGLPYDTDDVNGFPSFQRLAWSSCLFSVLLRDFFVFCMQLVLFRFATFPASLTTSDIWGKHATSLHFIPILLKCSSSVQAADSLRATVAADRTAKKSARVGQCKRRVLRVCQGAHDSTIPLNFHEALHGDKRKVAQCLR
jgi:hypothetical protein